MSNVTARTFNFIDHTRNERPIKTTIWYRDELNLKDSQAYHGPKHPLILLSHGSGSNRISLAWLARPLAEQGFIVASPDHYGNTFNNPLPEQFKRYWERPRDLSYLLSQLLLKYGNLIDQTQISAIGFSLGGYSVLALAGVKIDQRLVIANGEATLSTKATADAPELGQLTKQVTAADPAEVPTDLKDERFSKIVALAPALGTGLGSAQQTKNVEVPVLIIAAAGDKIAPIDENGRNYHRFLPQAQYHELPDNVDHFIFLPVSKNFSPADRFWYQDATGVDRNQIHSEVITKVSDFLTD